MNPKKKSQIKMIPKANLTSIEHTPKEDKLNVNKKGIWINELSIYSRYVSLRRILRLLYTTIRGV